jgi:hypothetical protein
MNSFRNELPPLAAPESVRRRKALELDIPVDHVDDLRRRGLPICISPSDHQEARAVRMEDRWPT